MDIEGIRKFLFDKISNITGLPVVWMNQNAPRPQLPYIALQINNLVLKDRDWQSPPDEDGMAYRLGEREFTLSVQLIGSFDISYLSLVADVFAEFQSQREMRQIPLSFLTKGDISEVAIDQDDGREIRYNMDLFFQTINQTKGDFRKFEVGLIEQTQINTTATKADGSEKEQETNVDGSSH